MISALLGQLALATLIGQCAPNVAPATIEAIIHVESGGNPYAVNVNLDGGVPLAIDSPADAVAATRLAEHYIAAGYSVDLGLMQVNSQHLDSLGMTVEELLVPCTNIGAGARILTAAYRAAVVHHGDGQQALLAALSAYNSGDFFKGWHNGYLARYGVDNKASNPYAADTQVVFSRGKAEIDNDEQKNGEPRDDGKRNAGDGDAGSGADDDGRETAGSGRAGG
jgi:type IV secretion system protein VirB1